MRAGAALPRAGGPTNRFAATALAALLPALASIRHAAALEVAPGFYPSTVVTGLSAPTAFAFLPDGRLLVTEQAGRLVLVEDGVATGLTTIPVCESNEMGLLGVAVDPDFAANGFVYVYRTTPAAQGCASEEGRGNEIARVTMSEDGTVVEGSLTTILSGIRAVTGLHNGGGLRMGPDGTLYVGVGDNAVGDGGPPGESTNPFAQDLSALEGKILRVNRDGSVPDDNPFVGQAGKRPEIFAYGFRNPWRSAFDPRSGRLWTGDVGEATIEEVDVVAAGGNHGWPLCEGTLPEGCAADPDLVAPVLTYSHEGPDRLGDAVIGGDFADDDFGPYGGDYFFGDLTVGTIYHVRVGLLRTGVLGTPSLFLRDVIAPVDIQFGSDGALYYLTYQGEVRKVVSVSAGEQLATGEKLRLKGGRQKDLLVTSRDLIAASPSIDDPVVLGGSLRVIGNGFDNIYSLPSDNWRFIGGIFRFQGFEYRDFRKQDGPITRILVMKDKKLRIEGSGPGLLHEIGPSDPSPVDVVLHFGARRLCLRFGGEVQLRNAREFTARNAPSPAQCPD